MSAARGPASTAIMGVKFARAVGPSFAVRYKASESYHILFDLFVKFYLFEVFVVYLQAY
jgi:hypothetical protein